jgi:hypothetical protein
MMRMSECGWCVTREEKKVLNLETKKMMTTKILTINEHTQI